MAEQHRRNLSVVAETLDQTVERDEVVDQVDEHIAEARRTLSSISNDRIALKVESRRIATETKENKHFKSNLSHTTQRMPTKTPIVSSKGENKADCCADRVPLPTYESSVPKKSQMTSHEDRLRGRGSTTTVRHISSRSRVVPSMRSGSSSAVDILLQLKAPQDANSQVTKKRKTHKTKCNS